jgi:pyrroloquinoline quinone biosynthesis protein E
MQPKEWYPVLKDQVRLKKTPSCCWLVNGLANGERIHPLEAFVLALCSGEYSGDDLAYLAGHVLDKDSRWSTDLVNRTLSQRSECLDFLARSEVRTLRYNPSHYLYPIRSTPRTAEGRLDTPGEATLILTHQCNFRCIYCFNSAAPDKSHVLSTEAWLRILQDAADHGIVRCTISGGEPMMHPGFRTILSASVNHGMLPYVCTNGSFIDAEDIAFFQDIQLPWGQISLDTVDEDIHNRLSRAPGSLPRIRAAIRSCVNAGIEVMVKSVLTPINSAGVGDLIDSCHDWGVTRLTLDRFDLSNAGRGNAHLFLSPATERWVGNVSRDRQERYLDDGFVVTAVDVPRCWSGRKDIIVCGALSTGLTILPDGRVTICEKLIDYPALTIGDLRQQSLDEVWNAPSAMNVMRPSKEDIDPVCRECPELPGCHTGCFAQTLIVSQNPYGPDPRCWNARYRANPYAQYAAAGGPNDD